MKYLFIIQTVTRISLLLEEHRMLEVQHSQEKRIGAKPIAFNQYCDAAEDDSAKFRKYDVIHNDTIDTAFLSIKKVKNQCALGV